MGKRTKTKGADPYVCYRVLACDDTPDARAEAVKAHLDVLLAQYKRACRCTEIFKDAEGTYWAKFALREK